MADAKCTGSIRITKVPRGEAPIVIRMAWVGLVLPCSPYFDHNGFSVPQDQAITLLGLVTPKAAGWWRENGFPHPGEYFCFGVDEAEIVSGVTRQKLIVYDDMETGHWRRVL